MKTLIKTMLLALGTSISVGSFAQDKKKDTVKINPDPEIKKAAKKVGNKTAEIAVKGASAVVDKTYKGKAGPNGQTIYIDNKSRYYYVNAKGAKVYLPKSKLKNKPVTP
ncbi:hypothetical protein TH53_09840 [Pedobacter lusitanus]|uniref:Contig37, whole genome shotgun sequence n=1 Tax=Pedobacter lusitanus TaxID=1503925 RepID=A0A0D0GSJ1_9SPHI|nr:hypothetical protein [Pedobacter lusitanus]KIO77361.1 hypothetical protein TH53_09840 [Pedobacter lusitanus]